MGQYEVYWLMDFFTNNLLIARQKIITVDLSKKQKSIRKTLQSIGIIVIKSKETRVIT